MERAKYIGLTFASFLILSGCATSGNPTESKEDIFVAAYNDRIANGQQSPPNAALNDGNQSRLNVYARKSCRFASVDLQNALMETPAVNPEFGALGAYVVNKATELGVSSLTSFLKAAGQDRIEETPISTSLIYSQNVSPLCIEFSKNSDSSGRFIVELGIHHSEKPGVFRIVPIYLNYNKKSKSYLLNGGKRTIAIKLAFAEVGAQETSEIIINLGDWKEGDIAYFNHGVQLAENMNMASSWLKLTNHDGVPLNLNAVFIETTSGNKVAKLLAEEIEENQEPINSFIQDAINPPEVLESAEVSAFRDKWEPKVCDPGYGFVEKIKSGPVNLTDFQDLVRAVKEAQDEFKDELPADLNNQKTLYMDAELFTESDFYATDGQLLAETTIAANSDKLVGRLNRICRTRDDG